MSQLGRRRVLAKFGEENDVYPLTAMLSVNALDPQPPNVNFTLTMQWVGMDGFPNCLYALPIQGSVWDFFFGGGRKSNCKVDLTKFFGATQQ